MSKEQVAADIVAFLRKSMDDGSVASDDRESLEVAVDAIIQSFGVTDADEAKARNLADLYNTATPREAGTRAGTPVASVGGSPADQVSEAEQAKLEGNRFMARKQYNEAVEAYTRAIKINPNSSLYHSNRAAAYSQLGHGSLAVQDARTAVKLDPSYSKAYSRLGLALYSIGDISGALEAYELGLKAEGSQPSEGMRRGYETVKKRMEEESKKVAPESTSPALAGSTARSTAPETPSNDMFGGLGNLNLGALGGLGGGIGELLKNPEIQKMAQNMMSNPSAMANLLNNPTAQKLRESFATGKTPDPADAAEAMKDESLQNMMRNMMGGGK